MALADEVTARYPGKRLIQLTGVNDQDASAVNTTLLGKAVEDVQSDFLIYCATTYDGSDTRHVGVAVQGVVAYLTAWKDAVGDGGEGRMDRYLEALKALARVTGRDRVTPKSKSQLSPTAEKQGTETVRPDTDRPAFDDLIPNPPK